MYLHVFNLCETSVLSLAGLVQQWCCIHSSVRRDTGYPRVFFSQPLPAPVNTVPVRERVRFYRGYSGVLSRVTGLNIYIIILNTKKNLHIYIRGPKLVETHRFDLFGPTLSVSHKNII